MKFNRHIQEIEISPIVSISEEIAELRKQGRDVMAFQRGEMGFDTPKPIRDAGKWAIDQSDLTKYPKSGGNDFLREAIVYKLQTYNGATELTKDNVVVTAGGQEALHIVFQLMLWQSGLVISPCWSCVLYNMVPYSAVTIEHFLLEPDGSVNLERLAEELSGKKFLYWCGPSNPSATVFSKDVKEKIVRLCEKLDVLLIADEAYEKFVYDDFFYSFMQFNSEHVVGAFSFSKTYAMTGWRLGYLASKNQEICDRARQIQKEKIGVHKTVKMMTVQTGLSVRAGYTHNAGIPPFIQWAGREALINSNVDDEYAKMKEQLKERRDLLFQVITALPDVEVMAASGAFYLFPCFTKYIPEGLQGEERNTYIYKKLLDIGVGTVYGSCFGEMWSDYIRFSFSAVSKEQIEVAGERMLKLFSKI